jgi:hypothetical protein
MCQNAPQPISCNLVIWTLVEGSYFPHTLVQLCIKYVSLLHYILSSSKYLSKFEILKKKYYWIMPETVLLWFKICSYNFLTGPFCIWTCTIFQEILFYFFFTIYLNRSLVLWVSFLKESLFLVISFFKT